jgi:hypothetical protein
MIIPDFLGDKHLKPPGSYNYSCNCNLFTGEIANPGIRHFPKTSKKASWIRPNDLDDAPQGQYNREQMTNQRIWGTLFSEGKDVKIWDLHRLGVEYFDFRSSANPKT